MFGKTIRLVLGGMTALGIAVGSPFVYAEATGNEAPNVQEIAADLQHHGPRDRGGPLAGLDFDTYLADALGISVDELQAAKDDARTAMLEDGVVEGLITQEEADLMLARRALADYIDRQAITADVLGLTVEELEAAREDGTRLDELIEAQGLTPDEFREGVQAAVDAAIEQAVADGVITAEQAEQLQERRGEGPGNGGGFGGGPGNGGRGGHGGPGGGPGNGGPGGGGGFGGPQGDFEG